jgi:Fe-S oxidoreductase
LRHLGYDVQIPNHTVSGRTFLSKGMLRRAVKMANMNISMLHPVVGDNIPLLGIEPSGILTFRDEYPELCSAELLEKAKGLAKNAFMIEEFIAEEFNKGNISRDLFTSKDTDILLHGHCYQKSLAGTAAVCVMLQIPINYRVEEIKSGCCGMAGSFGYEKEHYELSMKVGEMILFPEVRNAKNGTIIAASGTSCRHQIADGTNNRALHPIEILWNALRINEK